MPSTATDRLNGLTTSVAVKPPCAAVSLTNITLSGLQTLGGVTVVEDDRVLVAGQTDQSENGIYNASTGDWTRAKDFDGNRDVVQGTLVIVRNGVADGALFEVTTDDPIVIGTSDIVFELRDDPAILYPQTAVELAAGVTPANTAIPHHTAIGYVMPERYGAVGDYVDACDDALQDAIAVAQQGYIMTVQFGPGKFKLAQKNTITGAGKGLIIKGTLAAVRGGSPLPGTTLCYSGAATPMFELDNTFTEFRDFVLKNDGSASMFLRMINDQGGRLRLDRISAISEDTDYVFSHAFVQYTAPAEYQIFERLELTAVAPIVFDYDGNDAGNSITTWKLRDSIIEASADAGDMTVLRLTAGAIELLAMYDNTFNGQGDSVVTVIDADLINASDLSTREVQVLEFVRNEWDNSSTLVGGRMLQLKNFNNAIIRGNAIEGGGNSTSLIVLTNSIVVCDEGNRYAGINGPIYTADSTSRIYFGKSEMNTGNTKGMCDASSGLVGVVDLTYSASMVVKPHLGHPGGNTTFSATINSTADFAINIGTPLTAPPNTSYSVRGQKITIRLSNTSTGTLGTPTWDSAFKMRSLSLPSTGKNCSITFECFSSTDWQEITRSSTDIPN